MQSLILYSNHSEISPFDFKSSICETIIYDKNINIDLEFDRLVNLHLIQKEYQNLIIPLCFGDILSDYLGLRLALHIRTTPNVNQNKNIHIYGFEGINKLINNEFFSILKTKGTTLINYSLLDIKQATESNICELNRNELSSEISKINLSVPLNHFDNHSIANLWGAFRLVKSANIDIELIDSLNPDDLKNIYFKWLQTKNDNIEIKNDDFVNISEKYSKEFKKIKEQLKNPKFIDLSKIK
ncbi:hypothetical protein Flavo103_02470 [Flavobacterium collinsii]|uniref:hypothetical protein n=1 Tax=Flavobacterium collinsii TaxID=1114861 RepID=UPI0022C22565|nr:hypothetical protein [Flavobacterium collinsii]GIQ57111.1 hypothetical protein Flavo103_02470 [Flavobacterium collinsii]